jgi:excisionase family DNA binding protein
MAHLIDAEQLSQRLGVKEGTIYDWVRRGKIPCLRLERLIRFDPEEINLWLAERKVAPRSNCL